MVRKIKNKLEDFFFSASLPRVYYYENYKEVQEEHKKFFSKLDPYPILLVSNKNNFMCVELTEEKHRSGKLLVELISETMKMLEENTWTGRIKRFTYIMLFTPFYWLKKLYLNHGNF